MRESPFEHNQVEKVEAPQQQRKKSKRNNNSGPIQFHLCAMQSVKITLNSPVLQAEQIHVVVFPLAYTKNVPVRIRRNTLQNEFSYSLCKRVQKQDGSKLRK